MSLCQRETEFIALDLPREFEGLDGLIQADLQAIVTMIAQRAHERLCLTRREFADLQATLWNRMTEAVHVTVAPLSIENR